MKKIFHLAVLLLPAASGLWGQEFMFEMYFEDGAGRKDTLVLGYDSLASPWLDPQFGEIDIKPVPFGASFEVRTSFYDFPNLDYPYMFDGCFGGAEDFTQYHTKKNITSRDWEHSAIMIFFWDAVFPITIRWDKSLFQHPDRFQAVITSWQPGGWFDVCGGAILEYLSDKDEVIIESLNYGFDYPFFNRVYIDSDTLPCIFVGFPGVINNTRKIGSGKKIKLFPNPTFNGFTIEIDSPLNFETLTVQLFDLSGKGVIAPWHLVGSNSLHVETKELPAGMYWVHMQSGGEWYRGRVVVGDSRGP
jgi:hypothetical protein